MTTVNVSGGPPGPGSFKYDGIGVTLIDNPSKHVTFNTNTFPGGTWIGTPGLEPSKWINPFDPKGAVPYDPNTMIVNNPAFNGYIQVVSHKWRATAAADKVDLSIDLPGVKATNLILEVEGGTVKVTGTRYDTGVPVYETYFVGTDYDPKSAEASLECGVLSVTLMKLKERVTHRVAVSQK